MSPSCWAGAAPCSRSASPDATSEMQAACCLDIEKFLPLELNDSIRLHTQELLCVLAKDFLLLLVADVAPLLQFVHGSGIFGIEMRIVGSEHHAVLVEFLQRQPQQPLV